MVKLINCIFLFLFSQSETNIYLDRVETYLGSKYKKVVYRQYDDITFTNQTVRNEDEIHLDILGIDTLEDWFGVCHLVLNHWKLLST